MSDENDDLFSAAFDEAASNAAPPQDPLVFTAEGGDAPEPETEAPIEGEVISAEAEVPEVEAAPEGEVIEGSAEKEPPATIEPDEDISAVFARLYGKTPDAPAPAEPAAPAKAEAEAPNEREEKLAALRKDWPEVDELLQAELARVRAEVTAQLQAQMQDFRSTVQKDMEPVLTSAHTAAQDRLMAEVRAAHADFDTVLEPLVRWVDKQPPYLKPAYLAAMQSSNAGDAIDLIARFKRETGRDEASTAQPTQPVNQPQNDRKLRLLKQPGSRRSGVIDSEIGRASCRERV